MDIVFGGPLLFVPAIQNGNITDIEVFSPRNGHPVGATFLPGVWFTDAELNDPKSERWPEPESFSLLDPHSYAIDLTQTSEGQSAFPGSAIPEDQSQGEAAAQTERGVGCGHLCDWPAFRLEFLAPLGGQGGLLSRL